MKVIECNETRICENNFIKKTIHFDSNISAQNIKTLSQNNVLIFNEIAELPYFKIIAERYTIRGAVGSNRITIEFNSANCFCARNCGLDLQSSAMRDYLW